MFLPLHALSQDGTHCVGGRVGVEDKGESEVRRSQDGWGDETLFDLTEGCLALSCPLVVDALLQQGCEGYDDATEVGHEAPVEVGEPEEGPHA